MVVAQMVPDQISLEETRENVSEISEQLSDTLNLLTEAKERLIDIQDGLPTEDSELAQANTSLADAVNNLESSLTAAASELQSDEQSLEKAFDSLENEIEGALAALDQPAETVNLLHEELRSAIDGDNTSLTEQFDQAKGIFENVKSAFDEFDEELGEGQTLTDDTLQGLTGIVTDLQTNTQGLQASAEENFERLSTHVGSDQKSQVEASFDELGHQIADLQMGELISHFGDLDTQLSDIFETFSSTTDQMGDEMMELGTDLFQQVGDIVSDEIEEGIKDLIDDTVETTVKDLFEEVAQNMAMMQIGISVTTALVPYIPIIITAKAVLGTIKRLLSMLKFGF